QHAELGPASLVTQDFGGPAWLSAPDLYPLDFLGLCDRSVALIRRDRADRGGSIGQEPRLFQYLLHEQPAPPSWIYVPRNFWPTFELSPEYRASYFRLDPGLLPRARSDAFLELARAELVDYFPPLARFEFGAFGSSFSLLGAGFARARDAAPV